MSRHWQIFIQMNLTGQKLLEEKGKSGSQGITYWLKLPRNMQARCKLYESNPETLHIYIFS